MTEEISYYDEDLTEPITEIERGSTVAVNR